jgi:hypothetical protein
VNIMPLAASSSNSAVSLVSQLGEDVQLLALKQGVMEELKAWVEAEGLQMHPTKTRLVDATQKGGFDFLGYHFEQGKKWPRKKSLDKWIAWRQANRLWPIAFFTTRGLFRLEPTT